MGTALFDYHAASVRLHIPGAIVHQYEKEAKKEFPFDPMMAELHILRALNSYSRSQKPGPDV
jgi:hypothetical protein